MTDESTTGVPVTISRRRVLGRWATGAGVLLLGACGSDRSNSGAGAGATDVGSLDEVLASVAKEPKLVDGRFFVAAYPAAHLAAALAAYPPALHEGLRAGLVAVSQKCTHLNCPVAFCSSSGLFECPCHEGKYSAVGEYLEGPPPRGMDLFPVRLVGGRVAVEASDRSVVTGLARTVDITGQQAAGPHCATG